MLLVWAFVGSAVLEGVSENKVMVSLVTFCYTQFGRENLTYQENLAGVQL